jgi:hypothetical protein
MTTFLMVLTRFVAPFLMGVFTSVSIMLGDSGSISALLGVCALWFFSNALPAKN